ncbi:hypothetical protein [Flavobacterium sp.]
MKKILFIGICLAIISCSKKEVLLPQIPETVVADVKDHSPIYMFMNIEKRDTLLELNRKSSIVSTNWLFNIDKRLPLRLVVPQIQDLQRRKESSSHKNDAADNYYTYMDSKKRTLAFLPFTGVTFDLTKPNELANLIYFKKNSEVVFNNQLVEKPKLEDYLNNLKVEKETEIYVGYDKNLSFEEYLVNRLMIKKVSITKLGLNINYKKEYIY